MTRIIAGTHGGRRLAVPAGLSTRPTSDRAREALFSSLLGEVEGGRVLDLYSGTGALGLEALSRGAAEATFVERDPQALVALRANVASLGLPATVVAAEVGAFLAGAPSLFDVVLLDPPYEMEVDAVLAQLPSWLAPGAVVVVERGTRAAAPVVPADWASLRRRRYGEATLWYFRAP